MGKGDPKKNERKKTGVPGSGGTAAGAGGQGDGGARPEPRRRWEFNLETERASSDWKGREVWGKVDRDAVYVELPGEGSLGRVPNQTAEEMIAALKELGGRLQGEILIVRSPTLIRVEMLLV